jgi:hypothetical protein
MQGAAKRAAGDSGGIQASKQRWPDTRLLERCRCRGLHCHVGEWPQPEPIDPAQVLGELGARHRHPAGRNMT